MGLHLIFVSWCRLSALVATACWVSCCVIVIASVILYPVDWPINLGVGLLFIATGWFLSRRVSRFFSVVSQGPCRSTDEPFLPSVLASRPDDGLAHLPCCRSVTRGKHQLWRSGRLCGVWLRRLWKTSPVCARMGL